MLNKKITQIFLNIYESHSANKGNLGKKTAKFFFSELFSTNVNSKLFGIGS